MVLPNGQALMSSSEVMAEGFRVFCVSYYQLPLVKYYKEEVSSGKNQLFVSEDQYVYRKLKDDGPTGV